ncbi:MAG: phosphoglucosamine mutase, partial [Candidatus Delongbacteria bacterium]
SKLMLEKGLVIGGEGNGGIILPEVHPGRDALVGAALILQYLAEKNRFVSDIVSELPEYHIVKDKVNIDGIDFEKVSREIMKSTSEESLDLTDGIKINGDFWWVQLRKSNTEPIARIFAEARTKNEAEELVDRYRRMICD